MKRWWYAVGFILALLMIPVSCRQLFTTSLASPLARTSITIPPNATTSELLILASSDAGATPEGAKALLDALSGRADEVKALSADDKSAVLDLAVTATINMDTLTKIAESTNTDQNATMDAIFKSFDPTVNTVAVMAILEDTAATADIPAEKLILSGAILLADAAETAGTTAIISAIVASDTSTLPAAQKTELDTVIALRDKLTTTRKDELATLTIGSYNIGNLLEGTI